MVAVFKAFLFTATAVALPSNEGVFQPAHAIEKRDFTQVTKDLSSISASATALSKSLIAYTTTTQNINPIVTSEANLESIIKKTTGDVNSSPVPTSAQAQTICDYFKNTLNGVIKNSLNALLSRKTVLDQEGLQQTVLTDLENLSSESGALATAFISKAPASQKSCASSASSVVIGYFNSAISAWQA